MSMQLGLTLLFCCRNQPVHLPRLPAASWLYLKLLKNLLCSRFASWLGGRVLRRLIWRAPAHFSWGRRWRVPLRRGGLPELATPWSHPGQPLAARWPLRGPGAAVRGTCRVRTGRTPHSPGARAPPPRPRRSHETPPTRRCRRSHEAHTPPHATAARHLVTPRRSAQTHPRQPWPPSSPASRTLPI